MDHQEPIEMIPAEPVEDKPVQEAEEKPGSGAESEEASMDWAYVAAVAAEAEREHARKTAQLPVISEKDIAESNSEIPQTDIPEEAAESAKPEQPVDKTAAAYDWLESLVTAVSACILIFLFLFRIVNVDGSSMVPTLQNGDKLVISRLAGEPKAGDIVVLTKISFSDESIVKRVIATEGQTIDIDFTHGTVTVDGTVLNEPYIAEPTMRQLDFSGPVTVPEGCVFCMGDNRNHSTDSRDDSISMIDRRCILGKLLLRLFPIAHFGRV